MLKVIGSATCQDSSFESDPWIPFKVTWSMSIEEQPLYARISGRHGGEVEIKVDPRNGLLLQAIVIEPPPTDSSWHDFDALDRLEGVTAVIDLAQWGTKVTPDYQEPATRVTEYVEDLTLTHSAGVTRLGFSSKPAARVLAAGATRIGVSMDGCLVAIDVIEG